MDPTSRLKSVTQERDLDEFFSTAELAGAEFTAGQFVLHQYFLKLFMFKERRNVKIIQQSVASSQNPYLLTEQEEADVLKKQEANKKRLRVPRRPPWTKTMTPSQLDKQEKAAFLDWRRGLAQ